MNFFHKKQDAKSLGKLLESALKKKFEWHELCSQVVVQNATGGIWLIGGSVSRTLVKELYGTNQDGHDYDFICDKLSATVRIPEGWEVSYTKFNSPTFTKAETSVDLWEIKNAERIKQNQLDPTIENFFAGVPFTIQAMAYDLVHHKLVGDIGIKALLDKEFKVNNLDSARELAKRKGTSIDQRMKSTADSMGFTVVPCNE